MGEVTVGGKMYKRTRKSNNQMPIRKRVNHSTTSCSRNHYVLHRHGHVIFHLAPNMLLPSLTATKTYKCIFTYLIFIQVRIFRFDMESLPKWDLNPSSGRSPDWTIWPTIGWFETVIVYYRIKWPRSQQVNVGAIAVDSYSPRFYCSPNKIIMSLVSINHTFWDGSF